MRKTTNRLLLPFILNLSFTVFELVGGFLTNSIALISDSIHDFGDSISIGIALILEKLSKKKPDETYTYGYRRFSLLGGLISAFVLLVGSVIVVYEAIPRLIHPELIDAKTLIWFSVIGMVVNLIAALRASKGKSINEKVIGLHLFEDAFGWVALFIGAIIMMFTQLYWVDSLLSILFTLYILIHVFKNIILIIRVFLEKSPGEPSLSTIENELKKIPHVVGIHHIHLWTLEGNHLLFTCHVNLNSDITKDDLITSQFQLHEALNKLGVEHSTMEYEFEDSPCTGDECQGIENWEEEPLHHHH